MYIYLFIPHLFSLFNFLCVVCLCCILVCTYCGYVDKLSCTWTYGQCYVSTSVDLHLFDLSQALSLNPKLKYLTRLTRHHASELTCLPIPHYSGYWHVISLSFHRISEGPNTYSYAYSANIYQPRISSAHYMLCSEK